MKNTTGIVTPYVTALPFIASAPDWLSNSEYEQQRIASYGFYEDLYRNAPDEFALLLRGAQDTPIYLPSAKRIVNTYRRYVGRNLTFDITGAGPIDPANQTYMDILTTMHKLWTRENFIAKFGTAKRKSLITGDGCLYISANINKPEGSRIKITSIDPATYFPIPSPDDPDQITGCDIIEQIRDADNNVSIKRQRYLKPTHPLHPNTGNLAAPIAYESVMLKLEDWDDPKKAKTIKVIAPLAVLPMIMQLPVYHFKTEEETGNPYGVSILQGLERPFLAINQAISDQDLSLSMAGLGMFATDSIPVDDAGNRTNWKIGPARVVEVPTGGMFQRVSGVASVEPSMAHIKFLQEFAESTLGISDVALGQVDTSTAESGVALAIRLGPIIDAASDLNSSIRTVLNQMHHDLKDWLKAYEKIDFAEAEIVCDFEDGAPRNVEALANRLDTLYNSQVISRAFYRSELENLYGYNFPEDMDTQIQEEAAAANVDPYANAAGNGTDPNAAGTDPFATQGQ